MKLDLAAIQKHIDKKTIKSKTAGDLTVYCYTNHCMFEKDWDETTEICRGIVLDQDGTVISKPFNKFYNIGEREDTKPNNLPKLEYEIFEKIDASLLSISMYKGRPLITTKCSFDNVYIDWFKANPNIDLSCLDSGITLVGELSIPDHLDTMRRVVPRTPGFYGLAAFDVSTGEELPFSYVQNFMEKHGDGKIPKYYGKNDLDKFLKSHYSDTNTEGYVVRYSNGFRIKLKTAWYMMIDNVLDNLQTPRLAREYLKGFIDLNDVFSFDNTRFEFLPAEVREEVRLLTLNLWNDFHHERDFILGEWLRLHQITDRKQFAAEALKFKYPWALFNLLDKKPFENKLLEIV